jgi:hypothetical protein
MMHDTSTKVREAVTPRLVTESHVCHIVLSSYLTSKLSDCGLTDHRTPFVSGASNYNMPAWSRVITVHYASHKGPCASGRLGNLFHSLSNAPWNDSSGHEGAVEMSLDPS